MKGEKVENGLYIINLRKENVVLVTEQESIRMNWHRKLGHINFSYFKKIPKICEGIPEDICTTDKYVTCPVQAKQVRLPFNTERERATRSLQIIHTDVCGPIDPGTYDGKRYFLTCIDDFTHFCVVYLLQYKSEVEDFLK